MPKKSIYTPSFSFSAVAEASALQLTHEGGVKFPAYLESMLWVYSMGHVPMLCVHDMGIMCVHIYILPMAFGSSHLRSSFA